MRTLITDSKDNLFSITDGEGASLNLKIKGDVAQVLSIVVPEENRRKGIGRSLLLASEGGTSGKGSLGGFADLKESDETARLF